MTSAKLSSEQTEILLSLGWCHAIDVVTRDNIGGHRICGQVCYWFDGKINGVDRSAWIANSGDVFLHGGPDMTFDAFIALLTAPAVSKRARNLFDTCRE